MAVRQSPGREPAGEPGWAGGDGPAREVGSRQPGRLGQRPARRSTPVGLPHVDTLSRLEAPDLQRYVDAVSEYVRESASLDSSAAKSAQIALSAGLGRCLKAELEARVPRMDLFAGELDVAGALRSARAHVYEAHPLDGLRLAVEIKPINLAVGRAIWNRFGDVQVFAVNIHLKFPFAVVGGVLALPTWEWRRGPADREEPLDPPLELDLGLGSDMAAAGGPESGRVDTRPLIERLVRRLRSTRRRETEADAPHLLEAAAVLVYDPDTGTVEPDLPPAGCGLRWDEFVATLSDRYDLRFE